MAIYMATARPVARCRVIIIGFHILFILTITLMIYIYVTNGPNVVGTKSWMASETVLKAKWKKKSDVQVAGMFSQY